MSTAPHLPYEALCATTVQVSKLRACTRCDAVEFCATCVAKAEDILSVVLPLLGDTHTEYTVRVTRDGRSHDLDDTATRDRARAERGAERVRGYKTQTAVVARTVTTGPWTEET